MVQGTVAVASGKGGTGKTTVAVNLAAVHGPGVALLDCDVEEPNAHLFLRPPWEKSEEFAVLNPSFDMDKCRGCGECRQHCRFNAIVMIGGEPMLFPELCHSCGACVLACPHQAISEKPRTIGIIREGTAHAVRVIQGDLNVGEAKSPPLIEGVRKRRSGELVVIDAPPGTSCPVIAAVHHVDYLVLVTEPTPFGLHDLRLAAEMAEVLDLRFGVVINRAGVGDTAVRDFCAQSGIPVLAELPYDPEVARVYSRGEMVVDALPHYREVFHQLLVRIGEEVER